jgi:hypothetical protein
MARGKASGTPVELGAAPARSDRLASAIRIMPSFGGPLRELDDQHAHRQPRVTGAAPREWIGSYGSSAPADVNSMPFGGSEGR